jgi:hypothetical protein
VRASLPSAPTLAASEGGRGLSLKRAIARRRGPASSLASSARNRSGLQGPCAAAGPRPYERSRARRLPPPFAGTKASPVARLPSGCGRGELLERSQRAASRGFRVGASSLSGSHSGRFPARLTRFQTRFPSTSKGSSRSSKATGAVTRWPNTSKLCVRPLRGHERRIYRGDVAGRNIFGAPGCWCSAPTPFDGKRGMWCVAACRFIRGGA